MPCAIKSVHVCRPPYSGVLWLPSLHDVLIHYAHQGEEENETWVQVRVWQRCVLCPSPARSNHTQELF